MDVKKAIATLSLAGVLAVGGAGIAGAQTADPPSSTSGTAGTITVDCAKVEQRIDTVQTHLDHLKDRVAQATARRDQLVQEGKTVRADRLTTLIDRANDRIGKVEARLQKVEQRVHDACPS